jgi:hypothetical protein
LGLVGGWALPYLPLWKKRCCVSSSVGMIFHSQLNGKIKHVPNHQPVCMIIWNLSEHLVVRWGFKLRHWARKETGSLNKKCRLHSIF